MRAGGLGTRKAVLFAYAISRRDLLICDRGSSAHQADEIRLVSGQGSRPHSVPRQTVPPVAAATRLAEPTPDDAGGEGNLRHKTRPAPAPVRDIRLIAGSVQDLRLCP